MIQLRKDISLTELDGEMVLMDMVSGKYFGLNKSGTRMVQLLQETGDQDITLIRLLQEFDAPRERLKTDLSALMDRLAGLGLLEGHVSP